MMENCARDNSLFKVLLRLGKIQASQMIMRHNLHHILTCSVWTLVGFCGLFTTFVDIYNEIVLDDILVCGRFFYSVMTNR